MTSFAFIFGVIPLVVASGAGAEMRRSLGIAVFSGMLGVTLFGIFLTPVFFYVIQGLGETPLFAAAAARWVGSTLRGRSGRVGRSASCSRRLAGWRRRIVLGARARRRRGRPGRAGCPGDSSRESGYQSSASRQAHSPPPHLKLGAHSGEHTAVISRFFIDRPIFATVLSVVIVLAGGVAVFTLPVAQYPEVTPPTVQVTALYPGANAQTVRDTVAAPIEEQVSGVEGMMYMSSQCTNDGAYNLTVTFKLGMDSDMAQVLVQNRVSLALPVIPPLVQNEGISVKKMSPNTLMIVNLISPDGRYDSTFLSNYATIYIKDELGRAARRRRHHLPRPARLQPAGLARPRQAGGPQPERHGRGHRHQPAERPGRRRADRPAARPHGPAISADHQHPGPAHRAGAVRRHHPQGRPGQTSRGCSRSRRGGSSGQARAADSRAVQAGATDQGGSNSQGGPCRRPPASSGCATWPASSWARSSTTSPAPWTASRPWRSPSTSCPAPTPSRPPTASTPR